jgi:HPt (histidine-containing phosphotransfer) domain-containing protein
MPETVVIDPQSIENLRALNPGDNDEFLREIAGIFLEDTPLRIAELDQGLAAADVTKFTRAAHSIKGSSSNIGALALRAAADKLEHQARAHGLTDVAGLVADVKLEFERAQTALAALIAK